MFNIINHYHSSLPPQAPSFLDLGGALTAIGLIGLVYQFRTPLWTLILSIRTPLQRNCNQSRGTVSLNLTSEGGSWVPKTIGLNDVG